MMPYTAAFTTMSRKGIAILIKLLVQVDEGMAYHWGENQSPKR